MEMTQQQQTHVGLGCGTLVLIALIVTTCGNLGQQEVADEVRRLRDEVRQLSEKVDALPQSTQTDSRPSDPPSTP